MSCTSVKGSKTISVLLVAGLSAPAALLTKLLLRIGKRGANLVSRACQCRQLSISSCRPFVHVDREATEGQTKLWPRESASARFA